MHPKALLTCAIRPKECVRPLLTASGPICRKNGGIRKQSLADVNYRVIMPRNHNFYGLYTYE